MKRDFRAMVVVSFIVFACSVALPGCNRPDAPQERLEAAQAAAFDAMAALAEQGKPLAAPNELAERLGIAPERARAIDAGPSAPGLAAQAVREARNNFKGCSGSICICTGDDDCNDVFSNACRDASSDGKCFELPGGGVICFCTPVGTSIAHP